MRDLEIVPHVAQVSLPVWLNHTSDLECTNLNDLFLNSTFDERGQDDLPLSVRVNLMIG